MHFQYNSEFLNSGFFWVGVGGLVVDFLASTSLDQTFTIGGVVLSVLFMTLGLFFSGHQHPTK